MKRIGYIRVSTVDQNSERQLDGIELDEVFEDKCSGKDTNRPNLQALLKYVRKGDEVHVHDISRMARNLEDLISLVKLLNSKGVSIQFHKESLTFTGEQNAMQELLLGVLGSVYQFERSMLLERQREGIQKAKEAGKYKGRPQEVDQAVILKLLASGVSIRKTAAELGVSVSTVQRVKAKAQESAAIP
ncbi:MULTISPECIES: recombinase family protein [unclassified Methylophaga]|uniref:recombinase family protein n=1 Tax=unclassified Methylophaga TaxID=2629249 RepID=UPI000C9610A3|nr:MULTISPECIES: recombinase family protein [unclassified Methylophaga]MBN46062.1 resolvase [Methylophaga sp.]|tara:strand:+ start:102866 stop:103429 length:564 start_codon:yes stop_codon:yes gene_type:complete